MGPHKAVCPLALTNAKTFKLQKCFLKFVLKIWLFKGPREKSNQDIKCKIVYSSVTQIMVVYFLIH